MSTSVMGYSPESPRDMSPDTSPYPDRPIRPLPKRRLRERLSPDVAESIEYPPTPKSTTPLFYHPYGVREESGLGRTVEAAHPLERERLEYVEQRNYVSRKNGGEEDSDEDEAAYRSRIYSRHSVDTTGRSYRYVQKPDSKHPNPQPPASTTSSADGYDSFENTNNKKKRKIPTPGDTVLNGVHLTGDVTGIGISGIEDLVEDVGSNAGIYHNSNGVGQGISGPGRGRYGRIRNGRSPLRTLSDASSNWGNSRSTKQRQPQWSPSESPGIISRSIANANAEKSPIAPSTGQENISLLQQQASKRASPASTQFTFTCDSQVPSAVPWPALSSTSTMNQSPAARGMTAHATQPDPNVPNSLQATNAMSQAKQGLAASQHAPNSQKPGHAQTAPKKTRRRTGSKEYLLAARQRRQSQEFKNYHHPPAAEDVWICEFCEYERIFGTPPEALIRQYEIKDRHIKKQEKERKRLLEKAKMKNRKGKKGKTALKSTAATTDRAAPNHQVQQPVSASHSQSQSQDTQSEEYYEDDYDDDYAQDDPPPPSPIAPPVIHGIEHERPDPGKHNQSHGPGMTSDNRVKA